MPGARPQASGDASHAAARAALEALGPAIAQAHPQLARLIAHPGGDPDVARLLEGIAYLGTVLDARAEACAPALTGQLAAQMAPALMRPQPAVALCALVLPLQGPAPTLTLPAHTALRPPAGAAYRTVEALEMVALQLEQVRWQRPQRGRAQLTLTCRGHRALTLQHLIAHPLVVGLGGGVAQASALHLALSAHLSAATLHTAQGAVPLTLVSMLQAAPPALTPTFADEAPLPPGEVALRALMLLPQALCRLRLRPAIAGRAAGADAQQHGADVTLAGPVTLVLEVAGAPGLPEALGAGAIHLHAVPAVQVVAAEAIPQRVCVGGRAWPLRAEPGADGALQVLGVRRVWWRAAGERERTRLWPQHRGTALQPEAGPCWTLERRQGRPGPPMLRLHPTAGAPPGPAEAVLSADLWCCGDAASSLAPGELQLEGPAAGLATGTNICAGAPTMDGLPHEAATWALLGALARRGRAVQDAAGLRAHLQHLGAALPAASELARAQARRAEAVAELAAVPPERGARWRGLPVPCAELVLALQVDMLAGPGEAHLLAQAVDLCLADGGPVHAVTRLRWRAADGSLAYQLPLRCGEQTQGAAMPMASPAAAPEPG